MRNDEFDFVSFALLRLAHCSLCVSIPAIASSVIGGIGSAAGAVGSAIGAGASAVGGALGIGGAAADAGLAGAAILPAEGDLAAAAATGAFPAALSITPEVAGLGSAAADAAAGAGGLFGLGTAGTLAAGMGISGLAGLGGSVLQSNASQQAAQLQYQAAQQGMALQTQMYNANVARLAPWTTAGAGALGQLQSLTGTAPGGNPLTAPLTKPFTPGDLTQYPGYQFTLQQGLQAAQNGFAAQGLGSSGAAMKGAANYATGLAQNTYGQAFNQNLATQLQQYNMLAGQSQLGESAASGVANLGAQVATANAGLLTGGASALGAGAVGSANALAGGLGNIGNTLSTAALLPYFMNQNGLYGNSGGQMTYG